jgi:serralysin
MKSMLALLVLFVGAAGLTATSAHAQNTIADIVAASGGEGQFDSNGHDYDMLLNALIAADLVDALADPHANVTVFAPNDRAFIRLAQDLGYHGDDEAEALTFIVDTLTVLGEGDPIPVLTDILLYHVAPTRVTLFGVVILSIFDADIDTLQGNAIDPFFFRLSDQDPDFIDPRVRFPLNIFADNGVIHTIDRVLIPSDI